MKKYEEIINQIDTIWDLTSLVVFCETQKQKIREKYPMSFEGRVRHYQIIRDLALQRKQDLECEQVLSQFFHLNGKIKEEWQND